MSNLTAGKLQKEQPVSEKDRESMGVRSATKDQGTLVGGGVVLLIRVSCLITCHNVRLNDMPVVIGYANLVVWWLLETPVDASSHQL